MLGSFDRCNRGKAVPLATTSAVVRTASNVSSVTLMPKARSFARVVEDSLGENSMLVVSS